MFKIYSYFVFTCLIEHSTCIPHLITNVKALQEHLMMRIRKLILPTICRRLADSFKI